jgi:DNA polymerase-1
MIKTGIIDPSLALRMVRTSPEMAYDTETDGLEVTSIIVGYVFTDWEHSVYVPVRHEAGGNIPMVDEFEAELAVAFAERTRLGYRTIGHHLGFDLRGSLRRGIVVGSPCEDTQINETLIDDTTTELSLDACARRHRVTEKKGDALYRAIAERFGGMPDRKSMGNFWRMPGDHFDVVDYATGDGVSTLELWKSQQRILDEDNLRVPWQLECDLLPYVARMHHRGIRIDGDYAEKVAVQLKDSVETAKQKFPPGFNVRSNGELEQLFRANGFEDHQFDRTDPTTRHPNGQLSFREKWLEKTQMGQDILTIRQLEKAESSFIAPLVSSHNINGRVHAILNQAKSEEYGATGSRFSCSEPNLQAYPKRNIIIGKVVRPLVVADHGMVLEEADAMQQEPRFFTHYSEDEALIHGYRTGELDIHQRASDVLEMDREYAKRLGLGMLTMMSPKTLAMHMGYSLSEANRDHRRYLEDAFPRIKDFQDLAKKTAKRRGYVKSILGRRAYLPDPRFSYKAISRIIQNSGGEHVKTCLLRACQFEDAYPDLIQMLLTIHDSLIWQRDPGRVDLLRELVRIVENVPHEPQFNLIVPIPFEVGSGLHWSEASYGPKLKGKKGWNI